VVLHGRRDLLRPVGLRSAGWTHRSRPLALHPARRSQTKGQTGNAFPSLASRAPKTGTIAVGEYVDDGALIRIRLHDPDTGEVPSALAIGNPSMGKSNWLRVMASEAAMSGRFLVIPILLGRQEDAGHLAFWQAIAADERLVATTPTRQSRSLRSSATSSTSGSKTSKRSETRSHRPSWSPGRRCACLAAGSRVASAGQGQSRLSASK
jgi:hypothetical protein